MSKFAELKEALLAWRKAEKERAYAVLGSCHPDEIARLTAQQEKELHRLRVIVDSEPWADIGDGF